MARAPRKKTVKTEAELAAHRARQARYRKRLRETRNPESDDVQRIVFAVLRDITLEVRQNHLRSEDVDGDLPSQTPGSSLFSATSDGSGQWRRCFPMDPSPVSRGAVVAVVSPHERRGCPVGLGPLPH